MNISAIFINRPVATTLLTLGIIIAGICAYALLPVVPLPQVDFPMVAVNVTLPGASPETMASTIATPLERTLGRIAGVTEMTSTSALGSTNITIMFDLDRNIDGAARDVQAAINAAGALLPTGLPKKPIYRKVNPADAPIMVLSLTSQTMKMSELYDAASTILSQKISQIGGVGQVTVGGAALPAVRMELSPFALNKYGIGLEQVRQAIAASNQNRPKGAFESADKRWQIQTNDQLNKAKDYMPLIISTDNNSVVHISDVGRAIDSVQDIHNAGNANGSPAIILLIFKQPNANIIETIENVDKVLPALKASIPKAVDLTVIMERVTTIKASLHDVERTLIISIFLVILVVLFFLRDFRSASIPSVTVPVSLLGTFSLMYLFGYSLDNLSLMAITIATGFVVDDAIVVLENISRHIEKGVAPFKAAFIGTKEVSFTVISMSVSLIAVFIPILFMGGIVGRFFQEFAVTLSIAVLVSLIVSLTLTPMMCARILKKSAHEETYKKPSKIGIICENFFNSLHDSYAKSLNWALRHNIIMMLLLFATIGLNIYLFIAIPKGLMPSQDTGRIMGSIQADQAISFALIKQKLDNFVDIIKKDPAVANVVGIIGGGQQSNSGRMFISLKSLAEREVSVDQVINRLRGKLNKEAGAKLYLQSSQDVSVGGRQSAAQYQYTIQADHLADLRKWTPLIYEAIKALPEVTDVNNDAQEKGEQTTINYDRDTLYRFGLTPALADATLNDAFGQRQISVIYNPLNQYQVVMELDPKYSQSPESINNIFAQSKSNAMIPMNSFSNYQATNTPLVVNHQGQFAAATISFNLKLGGSLSDATEAVEKVFSQLNVPSSVHGSFQGTAKVFKDSSNNQGLLIAFALLTIYIVLGILYESYIHPITILSTIPSAGVGALLALKLFDIPFTLITFIGVILLIGIVKKNAIMMIDLAIVIEREENTSPQEAVYRACLQRFRPIMMTTMAAMFGALPLAFGLGEGAEFRTPLGIAIVGGLIFSQLLTLYTTPVIYLYLDRLSKWWNKRDFLLAL